MRVEFKCFRRNAAASAAVMRLKQYANTAIIEVLELDPNDHPVNSLPCSFPPSNEAGIELNISAEEHDYPGDGNPAEQIYAWVKHRGGFGTAGATVTIRCRKNGQVKKFTAGSTRVLQSV